MIGLSWDLYDASKTESQRSVSQRKSALSKFPGVLETLAFSFTPTAFLTGPQFTRFNATSFYEKPVLSLFSPKGRSKGSIQLPDFITNKDSDTVTRDGPVLKRRDSAVDWSLVENYIKSHAELYDPEQVIVREAPHTACANISLKRYIFATNTDDLVAGFNINTNRWLLDYVYKRLRFLGNKNLSQIISLLFLALWHGTYSGYYVNFGIELLVVTVEKDFLSILKNSKYNHFFYKTFTGRVISSSDGSVLFVKISSMVPCKPTVKYLLPPLPKSQSEKSSQLSTTMNGDVTSVIDQLSSRKQQ
ncbi:lysophospholipid acyltransferase 5 [Schistosoma bovis]|uniref:Lysophospholipid acyltransferase 5 n=1 Tax=Schistosoma bovis TaxID=6184 RepID=A0A430QQ01_SCHBO|nr:lysophospholipid acyltransferase 5 [Schistosoma bovis]